MQTINGESEYAKEYENYEKPRALWRPRIIAIEGLDGTGKESVAKAVVTKAQNLGINTQMVSFPRYGTPIGDICLDYQKGAFGKPTEIDPFLGTGIYTLDRKQFFGSDEFYQNMHGSSMLILDRSYYSNFIHQGMKLPSMKTLAQWMDLNFKLECQDALRTWYGHFFEIYYLELSEEDRRKQIAGRDEQDENELDNDYQVQCNRFVHSTQTRFFANSLQDEFERMNRKASFGPVYDAYVRRVQFIPVVHEDDPEKIPAAVDVTAEKIIQMATRYGNIPPQEYDYLPDVIERMKKMR